MMMRAWAIWRHSVMGNKMFSLYMGVVYYLTQLKTWNLVRHLFQGCQTHFHGEQHEHYGGP